MPGEEGETSSLVTAPCHGPGVASARRSRDRDLLPPLCTGQGKEAACNVENLGFLINILSESNRLIWSINYVI